MISTKLLNVEELGECSQKWKSEGKTIAHCHGCFDLMHPGHIKHFKSAKKLADILVVTLTQDKFVNKGPGRPVYNENLRAESIASLECVDFVAINNWPTAIETINLIKPHYYVKGPDYKDQSKDITENIRLEEKAVIENGGILHITNDESMSSSKLINMNFSQLDDKVQKYLDSFKTNYNSDKLLNHIDSLKDLNVLVIGDTIIDEYHTCTPLGKSSKSPTISSIFRSGVSYAGGILAIANHINQYVNKVKLVTLLGEENAQEELICNKLDSNIDRSFFFQA